MVNPVRLQAQFDNTRVTSILRRIITIIYILKSVTSTQPQISYCHFENVVKTPSIHLCANSSLANAIWSHTQRALTLTLYLSFSLPFAICHRATQLLYVQRVNSYCVRCWCERKIIIIIINLYLRLCVLSTSRPSVSQRFTDIVTYPWCRYYLWLWTRQKWMCTCVEWKCVDGFHVFRKTHLRIYVYIWLWHSIWDSLTTTPTWLCQLDEWDRAMETIYMNITTATNQPTNHSFVWYMIAF